MIDKGQVMKILYHVVDLYNKQEEESRISKEPGTKLVGENAVLDSLGLVNFILTLESELKENFASEISLTDENIISDQDGPFQSIDNLADYIVNKLNEVI